MTRYAVVVHQGWTMAYDGIEADTHEEAHEIAKQMLTDDIEQGMDISPAEIMASEVMPDG